MTEAYTARKAAIEVLQRVLDKGQPLDEALKGASAGMEAREQAFCRAISMASLRHKGSIEFLIGRYMSRPLPKSGRLAHLVILSGAAQLLFVGSPAHAVVNEQVNMIPERSKFRGVVNAVLRRFDREGAKDMADPKVAQRNLPLWLWCRWKSAYGAEAAMALAAAQSRDDVPVDITVADDGPGWATRLGGDLLPTGSVRLPAGQNIPDLPGYDDGGWWVQDAAATLPVRLFSDLTGKRLLDACAAPGGKTAQAIAAGAQVTALDRSARRLKTLQRNLERLKMTANVVAEDLRRHRPAEPYDAVLLDAPCSATGTLRRHPDIGWTRTAADVASLVALQVELLDHAAGILRPGGELVYGTCSLEPEEGEAQVAAFLQRHPDFRRKAVKPADLGLEAEAGTKDGDLRTLPHHWAGRGGMDGFYASCLVRTV